MRSIKSSGAPLRIGAWVITVAPEFAGQSLQVAEEKLTKLGLKVGGIENQPTDEQSPETLLSLEPPAGTAMDKETSVNLVLAEKPAEPERRTFQEPMSWWSWRRSSTSTNTR